MINAWMKWQITIFYSNAHQWNYAWNIPVNWPSWPTNTYDWAFQKSKNYFKPEISDDIWAEVLFHYIVLASYAVHHMGSRRPCASGRGKNKRAVGDIFLFSQSIFLFQLPWVFMKLIGMHLRCFYGSFSRVG